MTLHSIAFAVGIVTAVVIVKRLVMRRAFGHRFGHHAFGHHAFAGGPCGGGGFGAWGRHRHRGGIGGNFWLRMLFARLDTTPGQERDIRAAIEDLRDRARDAKSGMLDTRGSLSKAVSGEAFDDAAFEAVSARVDATTEKMKDAFASALKRIHAVLDPKQRERFAELVSKGPFGRGGRRGGGDEGGPYRSGAEI